MLNRFEEVKDQVLFELLRIPSHEVPPQDLEKRLYGKSGASPVTVRDAVKSLINEGELAYTHKGPVNFVGIAPAERHHAARPMEVVKDAEGNPWLCDAGQRPSKGTPSCVCWPCGDLPFTRDD